MTQLRKQKGKKLPEDLASVDDIKEYKCKASHVVSTSSTKKKSIAKKIYYLKKKGFT